MTKYILQAFRLDNKRLCGGNVHARIRLSLFTKVWPGSLPGQMHQLKLIDRYASSVKV